MPLHPSVGHSHPNAFVALVPRLARSDSYILDCNRDTSDRHNAIPPYIVVVVTHSVILSVRSTVTCIASNVARSRSRMPPPNANVIFVPKKTTVQPDAEDQNYSWCYSVGRKYVSDKEPTVPVIRVPRVRSAWVYEPYVDIDDIDKWCCVGHCPDHVAVDPGD